MKPVEPHHGGLHQTMSEPKRSGTECTRRAGVNLGVVVLVKALLEGVQIEKTHHLGAWRKF